MTINDVRKEAAVRCWFLTEEHVKALADNEATRLLPVLVRCGGCRFEAPAQNVAHLVGIIERSSAGNTPAPVEGMSDYLRDVSLTERSARALCAACNVTAPADMVQP